MRRSFQQVFLRYFNDKIEFEQEYHRHQFSLFDNFKIHFQSVESQIKLKNKFRKIR